MQPRHLALALACAGLWGASFAVIRWGLGDLPPLAFASLRFVLVAMLALFLPRPALPWRALLAYGLSWGAIQFAGLFIALHAGMPSGIGSVLAQAQAFLTVLLVVAIGWERLRSRHLAVFALAAAGLAGIAFDRQQPVPALALAWSLAGAAGWAGGNVIVRKLQLDGYRADSAAFVAWASIVPAGVLGVLSLWLEDLGQLAGLDAGRLLRAMAAVDYQGLLALLLGTMAWNRLLRHYPASAVAPFSLLVPVLGLALGALVLHEQLSTAQLAGCLLLLAALAINLLPARRR